MKFYMIRAISPLLVWRNKLRIYWWERTLKGIRNHYLDSGHRHASQIVDGVDAVIDGLKVKEEPDNG